MIGLFSVLWAETSDARTIWIAFLTSIAVVLIGALAQWFLSPDYTNDIAELRKNIAQTNADLVALQSKMVETHGLLVSAQGEENARARLQAFEPKASVVSGKPPDHSLVVKADRPVALTRLEFMNSTGAVIKTIEIKPADAALMAAVQLPQQDLLSLAQSVRAAKGAAATLRYTLEFEGVKRSYELSIFIEMDFYYKPGDSASQAYWKVTG